MVKRSGLVLMGLLLMGMLLTSLADADAITLSDLPTAKSGFVYSLSEGELSDVYAVEVLNWKDLTLDAGYYRDEANSNDTGILAVAYKLGGLEKLGISVPLGKYIDVSVGYYGGYGRVKTQNSFEHGLYASIISVKF